jgi:hypothetical protein
MARSDQLLNDFTEYCRQHPTERFWQATLRMRLFMTSCQSKTHSTGTAVTGDNWTLMSETMIDPEKRKKFLKELSALTRRYRIGIAGCGCCGSPFLCDTKPRGSYECDEKNERLVFFQKETRGKR